MNLCYFTALNVNIAFGSDPCCPHDVPICSPSTGNFVYLLLKSLKWEKPTFSLIFLFVYLLVRTSHFIGSMSGRFFYKKKKVACWSHLYFCYNTMTFLKDIMGPLSLNMYQKTSLSQVGNIKKYRSLAACFRVSPLVWAPLIDRLTELRGSDLIERTNKNFGGPDGIYLDIILNHCAFRYLPENQGFCQGLSWVQRFFYRQVIRGIGSRKLVLPTPLGAKYP